MKRTLAALLVVGLAGFGAGFVSGFQLGHTPEPAPTIILRPTPAAPPTVSESHPV